VAEYRLYGITDADCVSGPSLIVECTSNEGVIEEAAALLATHPTVEVWRGAMLIHRLGQKAAATEQNDAHRSQNPTETDSHLGRVS